MGAECLRSLQVRDLEINRRSRLFEFLADQSDSNGCGIDIGVKGGKVVGVRGRAVDRVNKGRLGPKGLHG